MFGIGWGEGVVLLLVGLIVLGPERLPGVIRDAGRLLRSLRDMATGARQQLRDELGPEFADIDLRSLNPRTAITRAVFGDEGAPDLKKAVFGEDGPPDLRKYDPRRVDARGKANEFFGGGDGPVSMTKPGSNGSAARNGSASRGATRANGSARANGSGGANGSASSGSGTSGSGANGSVRANGSGGANGSRPRPRPRPAQPPATPATSFDDVL